MSNSATYRLTGGRLNAELAKAVVSVHSQYVGRGPSRGHAFFRNNVVVVVLEELLTKAERSLVDAGKTDAVMAMRRQFQATMEGELISEVERLTGCRVVACMSDSHVDPDMAAELFVLDRPVPGEPGLTGQSEPAEGAPGP